MTGTGRRLGWVALAAVALAALLVGGLRAGGASTQQERIDAVAKTIRCPVCTGESVYESRNPTSVSLRTEIARQVRAGRSDDQIRADLAARFGDDVLLVPDATGVDSVVWVLPVAVALAALAGLAVVFARWRRQAAATPAPSAADRALVESALAGEPGEGIG